MALDLQSKIGGVPVVAVGGVLGVVFVGFLYFKSAGNKAAAAAPTTVAVPDLGPGDQVDSTGTQSGGLASEVAMFLSNGTWTATALGWEVSNYGTSPLTVQAAVEKYLTGETLTYDESVVINRIIGKFGLPPQGVTGISTILPKVKIPLKDPAVEVPDVTPSPGTTVPATAPPVVKSPSYTSEFYDPNNGYTVTHLSDGSSLWSDQNKTYGAGTYMAGGNLYNADGSPANASAQAVQDRINAMFAGTR